MDTEQRLADEVAALSARVAALEDEVALLRAGRRSMSAEEPGEARATEARAGGARGVEHPARPSRPSLEARIGSQVFNRIGILALLIGSAWLLKFAIDKQWIGPAARVLVGLFAGAALIGWSEWFRRRAYRAFSLSLKALGTGVLYLSIWAAYTLFGLVPAGVALAAMVLVTVTNAWLCWQQNSEVLAFYAATGGLLTPLLLGTAGGRELVLFTYLLLLDLGVLLLVALRPWSRLLLVAFAGTAAYSIGWYVRSYSPDAHTVTAFFVVTFFLLFAAAPQLLRNLRLASSAASPTAEDRLVLLLLPLLNGVLAFAELYALLSEPAHTSMRPLLGFAFAVFYLAMLRLARSPRLLGTPTRLAETYLLLSVVALTGAIPVAASGRWIAVCWSAESVLLFALARRGNSTLLRVLGGGVMFLAFTGTVFLDAREPASASLVLNARFGTYLAAVAAELSVAWLASRALAAAGAGESHSRDVHVRDGWQTEGMVASWGATLLLLIGVSLEIAGYWSRQLALQRAERLMDEQFTYSAWTMLFGALLLVLGFWRKSAIFRWQGLVLLALSIAKVFLYDLRTLSQGYRIGSFLALGVLLLGVSFIYQRDLLGLRREG